MGMCQRVHMGKNLKKTRRIDSYRIGEIVVDGCNYADDVVIYRSFR